MVESGKEFIQRYWRLIICEILIVIIYVCFYTCSRGSNFEIIISPEILATLLVGIAAIYSWFVNRYDRECEKNLQMLKDIDKIHDYYKDKDSFPDVVKSCQEHIDFLKKIKKYKGTFLYTYLSYVEHKNGQHIGEEEQFAEQSKESSGVNQSDEASKEPSGANQSDEASKEPSDANQSDEASKEPSGANQSDEASKEPSDANQSDEASKEPSGANQSDEPSKESSGANQSDIDYPKNKSLNSVKNKIDKELSIGKEYIKYSKNYKDGDFQWSTWYSLDGKLIEKIPDEKAILFFTNVGGQYKGVKIKGNKLKDLSKEMKARNSGSNKIYDFYIRLNKYGKFEECRNDISLEKYEIEEIDLNFLNKN